MRLSTRGRYGVRALLEIARSGTDEPVSLKEIARRQELSMDYLEQLLRRLRRAGLVRSLRGPRGGFVLARPAAEITLWEALTALEQDMAPVFCVDGEVLDHASKKGCARKGNCGAHLLWLGLARQVRAFLEGNTLEDLVNSTIHIHGRAADGRPVMYHI